MRFRSSGLPSEAKKQAFSLQARLNPAQSSDPLDHWASLGQPGGWVGGTWDLQSLLPSSGSQDQLSAPTQLYQRVWPLQTAVPDPSGQPPLHGLAEQLL